MSVTFSVSKNVMNEQSILLEMRQTEKSTKFQQFRDIVKSLHCSISLMFPNTQHILYLKSLKILSS